MSESITVSTITREGVDSLSIDRGEPEWLKAIRVGALEKFLKAPSPTLREDSWRKTRVDKLNLAEIKTTSPINEKPSKESKLDSQILDRFQERAGAIYSTTGNSWLVDLDEDLKKAGVIFEPLSEAIKNHGDLLKSVLEGEQSKDPDKFELMQDALFNCGALLYIPQDLVVEKPFLVVNRIDQSETGASLFPKIIIKAESHSQISLINAFVSECQDEGVDKSGSLSLLNANTSILTGTGARVSYIEIQSLSVNCFLTGKVIGRVERDGSLSSLTVGMGGYQLKSEIVTSLVGQGAHGSMLGVVFGDNKEHLSYNTIQDHDAPNTTSDINFRVALKDEAVSAYQGNIKVAKEAQKTNAFQSNKNLLLGKQAKADSIPKLEILANDVKCSHGATVGPVDEDQVFFLMARGLDKKTAEELIVAGFFDTVLESLPDKVANNWIHELIKEKIQRGL